MTHGHRAHGTSTRLSTEIRSLLEHGFGTTFDSTIVVITPDAPGARPFATAERVVIPEPLYRPNEPAGRRLLAHEFAHVVQKRRGAAGRARARVDALEGEAARAAEWVSAGLRFACRLADTAAAPRYWNEPGHYYTCYFVLLAAGFEPRLSQNMAFFCQIPDMVCELDATAQGINWLKPNAARVIRGAAVGMIAGPIGAVAGGLGGALVAKFGARSPEEWQAYFVQTGLHALTGRPGPEETRLRANILLNTRPGSIPFGLALHAYGDSYAHRKKDGVTMHQYPHGHLERLHAPDYIHSIPSRYRDYGTGLYALLTKLATGFKPRITADALAPLLDEIVGTRGNGPEETEANQIECIRALADSRLKQPLDDFAPEVEQPPKPWDAFRRVHPELIPSWKDTAMQWAQIWSPGS